jgi:hypothetical protein
MQDGHDDFQRRLVHLRMLANRNTAPIIADSDRAIGMNRDTDRVAVLSESLVDGVINDFVNQVMQPAKVGAADIHAGSAPYRFKPLENLDVFCVVCLLFLDDLCHVRCYLPGM